jgi:hypothetical protein
MERKLLKKGISPLYFVPEVDMDQQGYLKKR